MIRIVTCEDLLHHEISKIEQLSMRQKDNTAGIYLIKHKPSGHLYVGQANDIKKRWRQHKKQLNAGTHHNNGLQKFWNGSNSEDFDFEIVILSPKGLSSLQLQRWLVKEERKIFLALKKEGVALNAVEPEIVATGDAVKEYKIEVKKSNKQWDKSISEQRHKIKEKIAEMENRVSPHRQRLYELRRLHSEKSNLIKKSTGWRRLFHGRLYCSPFVKRRLTV